MSIKYTHTFTMSYIEGMLGNDLDITDDIDENTDLVVKSITVNGINLLTAALTPPPVYGFSVSCNLNISTCTLADPVLPFN
jgi:hypothetical protein